ncbi:MAG: hypothetical protein AAB340_01815 [Patescibacteria group bacterium]
MKSQPVSWIGVLMSLVQLLVKELKKLGGGDDDVRWLVTSEGEDLLKEFAATIRKRRTCASGPAQQLEGWKRFYKKHFNLTLDLSQVKIPDHQEGFDRLLIVAKGLTRNQAYKACEKQFTCWSYPEDLDGAIKPDERDPKNGTYAIWVRDRIEADEENAGQSFNQRRKQKCQDENVLERMLHELKYFDETGKHLDIKNVTLTSSLVSDGAAVDAHWGDGRFFIDWCFLDDRRDRLRSRSVVSVSAEPSGSEAKQA